MARKSAQELLDDLEKQFHLVQGKINSATGSYLSNHQKDYNKAKSAYKNQKTKLETVTKRLTRDADKFRKSGTRVAQNQMKKTKAALAILVEALGEAKNIMTTAQDKLNAAKPFEKKLKARSKALLTFEKDWQKKQLDAEKAKKDKAKKPKAPKAPA